MKNRLVLVIAAALLLLFTVGLAAEVETSEYFYKTVPITKVYPHRDGYRIIYRRSNMELAVIYLPNEWFQFTPGEGNRGKGELVIANDPSYPYMSIFWKEGDFSHVRLYLHANKEDISWGDLDNPEAYNDKFDVESLNDMKF